MFFSRPFRLDRHRSLCPSSAARSPRSVLRLGTNRLHRARPDSMSQSGRRGNLYHCTCGNTEIAPPLRLHKMTHRRDMLAQSRRSTRGPVGRGCRRHPIGSTAVPTRPGQANGHFCTVIVFDTSGYTESLTSAASAHVHDVDPVGSRLQNIFRTAAWCGFPAPSSFRPLSLPEPISPPPAPLVVSRHSRHRLWRTILSRSTVGRHSSVAPGVCGAGSIVRTASIGIGVVAIIAGRGATQPGSSQSNSPLPSLSASSEHSRLHRPRPGDGAVGGAAIVFARTTQGQCEPQTNTNLHVNIASALVDPIVATGFSFVPFFQTSAFGLRHVRTQRGLPAWLREAEWFRSAKWTAVPSEGDGLVGSHRSRPLLTGAHRRPPPFSRFAPP